jgi:hypothetical protein
VAALMKGSLHSDELLGAVVATGSGLRTERRISHVYAMAIPTYAKPLIITDAAINITPTLAHKRDICQNAIDLLHVMGVPRPHVAVLAAVETVNPAMPSTLDAAALTVMATRHQITGALVDGPLAFDNAISLEASIKEIVSPVAGSADILLVPDLEAGNMLAKQLIYLAQADAAGLVLGARVPIILTSRADSLRVRLASSALARLLASRSKVAASARRPHEPLAADLQCGLLDQAGRVPPRWPRQQDRPGATRPAPDAAAAAPGDRGRTFGPSRSMPTRPLPWTRCWSRCCTSWKSAMSRAPCARSAIAWCMADCICRDRCCWTPPRSTLEALARWRLASAAEPAPDPRHRAVASRLPQTATFDTAFHASQDALARRFALPRKLHDQGVLRYGFHGISYSYIAVNCAGASCPRRTATWWSHTWAMVPACAASRTGAASMPVPDFPRWKACPWARAGALDAGVLLYLLQQGMTPAALEDLLYHQSGLLGVSGVSADVRTLQQSNGVAAREALELFALRCAGEAARLATLGGMDALVFTAGIGEHDAHACGHLRRLDWLGVQPG